MLKYISRYRVTMKNTGY